MTIINIGAKLDLIEQYLSSNETLNNLFPGGIYAGKPVDVSSEVSLYFGLIDNDPYLETDRKGGKDLGKKATFEFVIITNKTDIPDVEIYEKLDLLSNEIVGKEINLNGFIINSIQEGRQSGVLPDTNENNVLLSQYEFYYKNSY